MAGWPEVAVCLGPAGQEAENPAANGGHESKIYKPGHKLMGNYGTECQAVVAYPLSRCMSAVCVAKVMASSMNFSDLLCKLKRVHGIWER